MSEENKAPESLTLEKSVEAPAVPEIDKDGLLSELTKLGVKKTDDLINMKRASSETGKLANMLGAVRDENAELKRMIQQLQQGTQAGYQTEAAPVDLGQVVESKAERAVERVIQKMNMQQLAAQEQLEAELADVETDDLFPAVQDVWQKHLGSRATQMRLRRGETNITKEYSKLKDTYYKKMLEAHTAALQRTQSVKAPHVEQGNTHSVQLPEADTERTRKLKQIVENRSKRESPLESNKALEMMVTELFPPEAFK